MVPDKRFQRREVEKAVSVAFGGKPEGKYAEHQRRDGGSRPSEPGPIGSRVQHGNSLVRSPLMANPAAACMIDQTSEVRQHNCAPRMHRFVIAA
jgi:hypothetical protein